MRQGRVETNGAWQGRQQGGVKAPPILILPDPTTRFVRTAGRLDTLSAGHPLAAWLSFVARVAEAQHAAAATMDAVAGPTIEAAAQAGLPAVAAASHRRDPAWRDGLATLLDRLDVAASPAPTRAAIAHLRACGADRVEALADAFLRGDPADAAETFFVAAALQVYFTHLAASLPVASLTLLDHRGLCPCCGTTSVAGIVMHSDGSLGARYLHCALCATAWNHTRAVCVTCGQSGGVALKEIDDGDGVAKAETCNDCHSYSKVLYEARDTKVDPVADDLATLSLDLLMAEAGWPRHAANPLLLVGR
jgi:FdhE protein